VEEEKNGTICPMARPAVIKLRRTKMGQVTFDSLKAPLDRFLLPYYVVFWRAGACCRYRGESGNVCSSATERTG
jgi:hypothetical protein